MEKCTYEDCPNYAEFIDAMGDEVCQDCMEREINESDESPDDFQRFCMIN